MRQTNFNLFYKIVKAETHRLLHYPIALLIIGITFISPIIGLKLYHPIPSTSSSTYIVSLNSAYLGNFVLTGALIGSISFALLTALTLNRDRHARIDPILQAILPPYYTILSRVFSLLFLLYLHKESLFYFGFPTQSIKWTFIFV